MQQFKRKISGAQAHFIEEEQHAQMEAKSPDALCMQQIQMVCLIAL